MPRREQFYDPITQSGPPPPPELPPVRGMMIEVPGTYVLVADVAALLARYAEQFHEEGRGALLAASEVFLQMEATDAGDELPGAPSAIHEDSPDADGPTATPGNPATSETGPGAAEDDLGERVEVYANEDGTYWYARLVDHAGVIIESGIGGIAPDVVIQVAGRQWPGRGIHHVHGELGDSRWDEQNVASTFNGQRRPSPARLWGRT